jgi:hypothetical protein
LDPHKTLPPLTSSFWCILFSLNATGRRAGAGENAKRFRLASMCTAGVKPHFFQASCPTGRQVSATQSLRPHRPLRSGSMAVLPCLPSEGSVPNHRFSPTCPGYLKFICRHYIARGQYCCRSRARGRRNRRRWRDGACRADIFPPRSARAAAPWSTASAGSRGENPGRARERRGVYRESQSRRIEDRPADRVVPDQRFAPSGNMQTSGS